ncbi:MAG: hypothetical protein AAGK02_04265 [Pseudomonadota bacterium]
MTSPRALIAGLLTAVAIYASPANATPPDVIDIREEAFGINATHVFVIRTSGDNLGTYESMRAESFLAAIDLETGEEELWLLDRLKRSMDYSAAGEPLGWVVERDEDLIPVSPFAVLAERKAIPWNAVSQDGGDLIAPGLSQDAEAISVIYSHGSVYRVSKERLESRLSKLAASMAENVADHRRMSSITTRQIFADRSIPLATCKPDRVLENWALGGRAKHRFLRVNCSDFDEVGVTSVIVRLDLLPGTAPAS